MKLTRKEGLTKRHKRVRRNISGTADRPRLCVRKSLKHLYAQVLDDSAENGSRTIAAYTTASKETRGKHMRNIKNAAELGKIAGADLKARGIETIVFDRGGYRYHGTVKVLADSIREAGIKF